MATKTVTIAQRLDDLTARLALVEERLAELQSAPAGKKTKKAKAVPTEGEEKVLSPWLAFCARVTELLKEEENADAKTAVWPARLTFCGHLKTACEGEYDTLTDDAILEHALSFVAPEKVAKPKKPVEETAPKTPKKVAKPVEAPPAPKKKAVKKATPAVVAPNPFAEEDEGDF